MIGVFLAVFGLFVPLIVFIWLGKIIDDHCGPKTAVGSFYINPSRISNNLFSGLTEYTYFWQLHPFLFFIYIVFAISCSATYYAVIYGGVTCRIL